MLDWVIVRENSEGEYAGQGGRSHVGYDHEVATGAFSLAPLAPFLFLARS